jgi:hypothetical protein
MIKYLLYAFLFSLIFISSYENTTKGSLNARPISYPESWTLMQQLNWEKINLHYHYSPNIKNSIGFVYAKYDNEDEQLYAGQWNHLLFRKNKKKSQANLYSKLQLGQLDLEESDASYFHLDYQLSYDWETRRHFYAMSLGTTYDGPEESFTQHQSARIGIAPYLADYGKLHTWLMLQLEHHPDEIDSDNRLIWTPLIRLFKGDVLIELGVNSNQKLLFNSIIRF